MTALLPARVGGADVSARLPDGTVALEPPSKAQLPDAVPPPDAARVLQSCQDVPAFVPSYLMAATIGRPCHVVMCQRLQSRLPSCVCTSRRALTPMQRAEVLPAAVLHALGPSCRRWFCTVYSSEPR